MRRRIIAICLAVSVVASLVVAAGASAATTTSATLPVIKRVAPMRLAVGERVTIIGANFKADRRANTVVFRAPSGRSAFAKPVRASRTRLVVKVPAVTARLLTTKAAQTRPTRFKLRVLAGKFSKWTPRRLSPVLVSPSSEKGPGGGGGKGSAPEARPCGVGADWDGDLLSNDFEVTIKTDPCVADSDADGISDGFEEQSAIDLNHYPASPPLPYPGKRPYPNALDPSDALVDYDGDGLQQRDEFLLWTVYAADGVRRTAPPATLAGLLNSDGLQSSIAPPFAQPQGTLAGWALDQDANGVLADDERDGDGDGLSNWDESHGQMLEAWWPARHNGTIEPKESPYPGINFLDNADLPNQDALVDPDVDGDRVPDGADDYDHDGLSNAFEVRRPESWFNDAIVSHANDWAYTNPFNPCKPFASARCHLHPPFGYYESDEVPPSGPSPPAGYPDLHPETPDGY
jgi:hypothetical protein